MVRQESQSQIQRTESGSYSVPQGLRSSRSRGCGEVWRQKRYSGGFKETSTTSTRFTERKVDFRKREKLAKFLSYYQFWHISIIWVVGEKINPQIMKSTPRLISEYAPVCRSDIGGQVEGGHEVLQRRLRVSSPHACAISDVKLSLYWNVKIDAVYHIQFIHLNSGQTKF